jgi:hypothetical protein
MKLLLMLSMLATLMSSTYAQTYYLKKQTQRFVNEAGEHYKPFKFIVASGTVTIEKYFEYYENDENEIVRREKQRLIVNPDRQQPRVYTLNFEPIQTYRGLYFTATYQRRTFECWYNMECHEPYLLIERGNYLNYYHFKKEQ